MNIPILPVKKRSKAGSSGIGGMRQSAIKSSSSRKISWASLTSFLHYLYDHEAERLSSLSQGVGVAAFEKGARFVGVTQLVGIRRWVGIGEVVGRGQTGVLVGRCVGVAHHVGFGQGVSTLPGTGVVRFRGVLPDGLTVVLGVCVRPGRNPDRGGEVGVGVKSGGTGVEVGTRVGSGVEVEEGEGRPGSTWFPLLFCLRMTSTV